MANSMFFWEAAGAKFPASAAPAYVPTVGTNFVWAGLAFAGGTADESCYFTGVIPEFYTAAGGITWKFYWVPASGCTAADQVRWALASIGRVDDETFDAALGDSAAVTDIVTAGVDADLHVATATVATPSLAPGDLIMVKVTRDQDHADDDMDEDASLVGLQLLET